MKILVALVMVGLIVAGMLFLRAPLIIIVAPEHIFDLGPIAVTNTMFTSWVVTLLLCLLAIFAGRSMTVVPHGFSGAVEAVVGGFYGIVTGIAGEQNGRRFFWVIATIFLYVWACNYFGLLPMNNIVGKPEIGHGETQIIFEEMTLPVVGKVAYIPLSPQTCEGAECPSYHAPEGETAAPKAGSTETHAAEGKSSGLISPYFRAVNTDVNAPAAIAMWSFIFVEFWGLSALGLGYLGKFVNFGGFRRGPMNGVIDLFVGLLEFISELSRMISFTFRLFGNVFAGEVLLLMLTALAPLVLIQLFFGLELLVGVIQAFVFAMLTLVFAQTAVAHHGGDEHDDAHGEAGH
jgi:F-type H+-transporting ATPase subunit a